MNKCKMGFLKIRFKNDNEKDRAKKEYNRIKRIKQSTDIYTNIYPIKQKIELNIIGKKLSEKIEFDIQECSKDTERIFISDIRKNDVLLKHLLKECNIEFYHKNNCDDIAIKGIGGYFKDTLIITDSKNNNRIRLDKLGFENVNTIYLKKDNRNG